MAKRVLLTGATGFLGSHLCRALLQGGFEVEAYRRAKSDAARLRDIQQQIRWHDLPADLSAPFFGEPPEAIIHCAALYGRKGETATDLIEANTVLPVRLYEIASSKRVPLFINTDTVLDFSLNPYALSKHHTAQWLRMLGGKTRVLNLRVQHFYGPGDDPAKFITFTIRQCSDGVPEIALTSGQQRRDFIYVSDVVEAYLALLKNSQTGEGFAEFDVGSGQAVAVKEVVETIHRLTGSASRLAFGVVPLRPGEPMLTEARVEPLRKLGWHPKVNLEEGLRRTIRETVVSTPPAN